MSTEVLKPGRAAQPRAARPGARRPVPKPVLGLVGVLGFLLIWELVPRLGLVQPRFLPPASEVIMALVRDFGLTAFWVAVGHTLMAWAIGLAAAVVAAGILGLVIGMSPFLRRFTNSTIEFLRPVPSVALIPLAVLLFGVKIESSLMLIIYACFWQVLIQVLYGVADVDNVATQTAQSYGFSKLQRIRHVVFPTVLPYLMTGIRLAASVALILAITAELIIGSPGLGREIADAQSGGAISGMYALVLATGLLGVAINIVMRQVEQRLLSWHPSVRGEVVL
ncbi:MULTISPECIES: ABC transporter permease [unclassified Arthrobacter]|uniref:ABC transporter permease n=1 Tax=unclassified Arthrobacter TaxID=235627 RepID=UPI00210752FF|nr:MULTISPECIES: ABC transporter permease [unclassified Arthrobacter]MCQ1947415.1 ABC transporter permease [Arthrobacter sp. zg-Y1116]MCQ1996711.1 ABC transporter permease [Arthrobacter sp. zg-Y1171]UWX82309.1 ABC transporter permease [Arthrobacter sp. zg-Y1171]